MSGGRTLVLALCGFWAASALAPSAGADADNGPILFLPGRSAIRAKLSRGEESAVRELDFARVNVERAQENILRGRGSRQDLDAVLADARPLVSQLTAVHHACSYVMDGAARVYVQIAHGGDHVISSEHDQAMIYADKAVSLGQAQRNAEARLFALRTRAYGYYLNGEYASAESDAKEILKIDPQDIIGLRLSTLVEDIAKLKRDVKKASQEAASAAPAPGASTARQYRDGGAQIPAGSDESARVSAAQAKLGMMRAQQALAQFTGKPIALRSKHPEDVRFGRPEPTNLGSSGRSKEPVEAETASAPPAQSNASAPGGVLGGVLGTTVAGDVCRGTAGKGLQIGSSSPPCAAGSVEVGKPSASSVNAVPSRQPRKSIANPVASAAPSGSTGSGPISPRHPFRVIVKWIVILWLAAMTVWLWMRSGRGP